MVWGFGGFGGLGGLGVWGFDFFKSLCEKIRGGHTGVLIMKESYYLGDYIRGPRIFVKSLGLGNSDIVLVGRGRQASYVSLSFAFLLGIACDSTG